MLDDVSISGARGVLINITGGMDLAIDEVTQISSIIQEEAGEEAEIIFGAVHDPELEGRIRVTVIATGFDSADEEKVIRPDFKRPRAQPQSRPQPREEPMAQPNPHRQVVQEEVRVAAVGGGRAEPVLPLNRFPERTVTREQFSELDIPTFIRRQMD